MNFERNREIKIMGIVNITDDSYFSGSRFLADERVDLRSVRTCIRQMIDDGADMIDIGACSSRPGSEPISAEEEWARLEPVVRMYVREFPEIQLSVDTFRSDIARKVNAIIAPQAIVAQPLIINDISAGEDDPAMLATVAELGLGYIAMHKRGTSAEMASLCDYPCGVVNEVAEYFADFTLRAEAAGLKNWIIDPGFGFAKTLDQNYELLAGLGVLCGKGHEVLVGVSRKSMVYRLLDITPEESLAPTQVLHLAALQKGASILRVHDVAEAAQTIEIYRKLNEYE